MYKPFSKKTNYKERVNKINKRYCRKGKRRMYKDPILLITIDWQENMLPNIINKTSKLISVDMVLIDEKVRFECII